MRILRQQRCRLNEQPTAFKKLLIANKIKKSVNKAVLPAIYPLRQCELRDLSETSQRPIGHIAQPTPKEYTAEKNFFEG